MQLLGPLFNYAPTVVNFCSSGIGGAVTKIVQFGANSVFILNFFFEEGSTSRQRVCAFSKNVIWYVSGGLYKAANDGTKENISNFFGKGINVTDRYRHVSLSYLMIGKSTGCVRVLAVILGVIVGIIQLMILNILNYVYGKLIG